MGTRLAEETWPAIWESLRVGRWRQAEGLGRLQEAFASDPEGVAAAKVNQWLALDQGLGGEAIRNQVQAWDASDLPTRFEMARQLLLRNDDQGMRLLRDLVADGSVKPIDLATWPLFDRLRDEGRLADINGQSAGRKRR